MSTAQRNQARSGWLVGLIALAGGMAAPVSMPVAGPLAAPRPAVEFASPLGAELAEQLSRPGADAELAGFYQGRRHRALWVEHGRIAPEARQLIETLKGARADNLDAARYRPDALATLVRAAASGRIADLARAELALSRALADWGADLRRPRPSAALLYSDPQLRSPEVSRLQVLETVASASSLKAGLDRAAQVNPIYWRLREALAKTTAARGADAALIRANLERARALPVDLGRRFILVDVPAQRLWMYENGRPVDGMKVVVGKAAEPTPGMAALVRYAVFRPYWNVPADLVAKNMAPKIVTGGLDYFRAEQLQVLSDWSASPATLDPARIDWPAVAAGRTILRMRQAPGPTNMMGQVKFIFPNELGVYLHDSPLHALFVGDERLGSAGCVRLEDAPRLGRWLLGDGVVAKGLQPGPPETRVDLPEPTPVYITYFTVAPLESGAVSVRRDIYGRDSALIAEMAPPAGGRRALR